MRHGGWKPEQRPARIGHRGQRRLPVEDASPRPSSARVWCFWPEKELARMKTITLAVLAATAFAARANRNL